MTYRLLTSPATTKAARRLRALIALAIFPFIVVASLTVGTALHLWDFTRMSTAEQKPATVAE